MDKIQIKVSIGEQELVRNYEIVDCQTPDNMQENIQDMIDTLLDNSKLELQDMIVLSDEDIEQLTDEKRREEADDRDRSFYHSDEQE